ncbi:MAG: segregation/condensation protein A [Firmicutes bacterium]|nr:segregation/condensation protein A [Bacillota bacterium]
MTYRVQLPIFTGPLDLLLHLIERAEIDIYDIPIAVIAEQFLAYLRTIEVLDLETAGEFLLMAATLMQIKARMLLPRPVEEEKEGEGEEDPRRELVDRLLAYRQVKEAAAQLRQYEEESLLRYPRSTEAPEGPGPPVLAPGLPGWDLLEAWRGILAQLEEREPEIPLPEEQITVREAMGEILGRLATKKTLLFEEIFAGRRTRRALVVGFIALLELIRVGRVMVFQERIFGRISIRLREEPREA